MKSLAAGKLDRLIRIEAALEQRDEETGETTLTWPPEGGVVLAEVWAERLDPATLERFTSDQEVAEIDRAWQIRYRRELLDIVTPEPRFRVVDSGRVFDITGVVEVGRHVALVVKGKARAEGAEG